MYTLSKMYALFSINLCDVNFFVHFRIVRKPKDQRLYEEGMKQMKKLQRVLERLTEEMLPECPIDYLWDIWNDPSLSDKGTDD